VYSGIPVLFSIQKVSNWLECPAFVSILKDTFVQIFAMKNSKKLQNYFEKIYFSLNI